MASDALERAAKAMANHDPEAITIPSYDFEAATRAALRAALDPEDAALVEAVARGMLDDQGLQGEAPTHRTLSLARTAIAAIREHVCGEGG